MKASKIEWTDHTFNPWIGCTKVSPGCAHCYAEARDKRFGNDFKIRRRTSENNWKQPLKWNASVAAVSDRRPRVFCASLADIFDDEVPIEWLADLLALIRAAPNLDWQLLTKRPENWEDRLRACSVFLNSKPGDFPTWLWDWRCAYGPPPNNIWIGTSVEDQARADERIPNLLQIPAAVRFLSCEPLLGPVEITQYLPCYKEPGRCKHDRIDWVICGGESGPNARPMHPDWARSLRDQCQAAGVPFFFKQWGEYFPVDDTPHDFAFPDGQLMNRVGKRKAGRLLDGQVWSEFPSMASTHLASQ
jgi:protein gp37